MRSFLLNKLVRDNILRQMQQNGQQATHKTLTGIAYQQALLAKVVEEAQELQAANDDEVINELADIQEVITALQQQLQITPAQLEQVRARRVNERGGFSKGISIERLDLADDDPWVAYYAGEPEKYKELT